MPRRLPRAVYLPLVTSLILLVGLAAYYLHSLSAQGHYYDEHAFRVLSLVARGFSESLERLRTVLGAATQDREPVAYLQSTLADYNLHDPVFVHPEDIGRDGILQITLQERSPEFRVRAEYRRTDIDRYVPPGKGQSDPKMDVTVDLRPVIAPEFEKLGDDFFDDILIADSDGMVLYQQSTIGSRVAGLADLIAGETARERPADRDASPPSERSSAPPPSVERSVRPAVRRSGIAGVSTAKDVTLAGSGYRLYLTPLTVTFNKAGESSTIVICGLRRNIPEGDRASAVPHTFVIWTMLSVLTIVTLLWPLLKLLYMSPKERLQRKHLAYLTASIYASAALLTLCVLNVSYASRESDRADRQLSSLAAALSKNFNNELLRAVKFLDGVSPAPYVADPPDRAGLRQRVSVLTGKDRTLCEESYPYFHYLFWLDSNGRQSIKLTVSERPTPSAPADREQYFKDVLNNELATFPPADPLPPTSYRVRIEPVHSPNTYESYAVIAMRYVPANESVTLPSTDLAAKILVTKFESLVDPVVPSGFGFAVVDASGRVVFHSNSARNLQENFTKEAQDDRALVALLSQHAQGFLDVLYLGRLHRLFVRPLTDVTNAPLSVIVFRDETYFSTINATVMLLCALLMFSYALPLLILVPIYAAWVTYPLDGIWPSQSRVAQYMHLLVAEVAVLAVFAWTYKRAGPIESLVGWPVLLAYAGAAYPWLQRPKWPLVRVASRLVLVVALLWFAGPSIVSLVPIAYVAASLPPGEQMVASWGARLSLRLFYPLVALAVLTVLAVAPTCALFKFSYDSIQRLEVAREAMLLTDMLHNRAERIHAYYTRLHRLDLESRRRKEDFDRYDQALSVKEADTETETTLQITEMEKTIAAWCAWFPANTLVAQLQQLAITANSEHGRSWMNALFTDENRIRQPALILRRDDTRTGLEQITLPVPSWTGLNAMAVGLLVVVILVLYLWLAYFTWKMFLVDLAEAPELEVWNRETSPDRGNIVVIGAPKTGRRQAITALPDTQMISFAELATKDSWDRVILTHHRVGLYYFEFDLDNPETNDKKLKLLERLLYVEGKRVILVSAVDPMYYLACSVASASADAASGSAAVERLERWAAIFSKLQKVGLPIDSPHLFEHPRLRGRDDPQSKNAFDVLQEECETQGALHEFGCRILPPVESTSSASVERDKIIAQLLDQADPYYRLLWGTCTADERLVLFQLAYDGWANPKNTKAIQHLLRRGLVVRRRMAKAPGDAGRVARPVGLRIMNESFRTFVLRSQHPLEMERWEREGRESLWRALRLSFLVAGFLGAVWIVQAYPSVSTVFVGSLGIVISVLSGVAKFFSDMRSPAVVATAVKPGA